MLKCSDFEMETILAMELNEEHGMMLFSSLNGLFVSIQLARQKRIYHCNVDYDTEEIFIC